MTGSHDGVGGDEAVVRPFLTAARPEGVEPEMTCKEGQADFGALRNAGGREAPAE